MMLAILPSPDDGGDGGGNGGMLSAGEGKSKTIIRHGIVTPGRKCIKLR